jgi:hypothetical protein
MNKIFQIGFNKCATTSLSHLFEECSVPSLRSVHWDSGHLARRILSNHRDGLPLLQGYEDAVFFSDMEAFYREDGRLRWVFIPEILFRELDRQYPGSKFILNVRDVDAWIASRLRHSTMFDEQGNRYEDESRRRMYFDQHMECFGLSREQVVQKWRDDFESHVAQVKEHFEGRGDLLVYDIDRDGLGKMLDFFRGDLSFSVDRLPRKYENGVWDA